MRVYILLYNAGTENEGIHTLQIGDRNKVLMFESADDATRYGLMLEAQDFPSPSIEAIDMMEVEEFCRSAGYSWELVEEGMLTLPPENNLESTNWSLETKEKPEQGEMSEAELERIRRQFEGLL